jgi:hypothetical protein
LCVQGYHLGADDAAIYVPGIKQAADPALYPFGAEFIHSHASLTVLPLLVGGSARLTRLPVDFVIFAWYVAGIFLLLLASWRLLCACFATDSARWGGVALLAAVLAVPVAGTALAIADPYMTARTLSTPATIFAIACFISGHRKQAAAWWLFTALIHPQMSVYAAVFLGCLAVAARQGSVLVSRAPAAGLACFSGFPFLFEFQPARGPAREALLSRTYFFVSQWTWYEWIGVFAPLALLGWFALADPRGAKPAFRTLARALMPFGLMSTMAGILLTASTRLENYTRLQPMRSLHLIYVIFFLLVGGLVGEYALRKKVWRWVGLFAPLGAAMCLLQISDYPASAHVEWPGAAPVNRWSDAFLWIRHNTPKNAVFAIDPGYMSLPGEDMHGFRAVAERSILADSVKDSGAVSLFPGLADEWQAQVRSTQGWKHFPLADFERVARQYPVTWFVTEFPRPAGLLCPYHNQTVAVCQLPPVAKR